MAVSASIGSYSIRIGSYDHKTHKSSPTAKGFTPCLLHINQQLSPYKLKTRQGGYIVENYLTFHALFMSVKQQTRVPDVYSKQWDHPAEVHATRDPTTGTLKLTPQYWAWRKKGFAFPFVVLNPNGTESVKDRTPECYILGDERNWVEIDEVTARRIVYYQAYCDAAEITQLFSFWRAQLQKGIRVQINSVGGPQVSVSGFPFTTDMLAEGSLPITKEVARAWVTKQHTQKISASLCLAVALLNQHAWMSDGLEMYAPFVWAYRAPPLPPPIPPTPPRDEIKHQHAVQHTQRPWSGSASYGSGSRDWSFANRSSYGSNGGGGRGLAGGGGYARPVDPTFGGTIIDEGTAISGPVSAAAASSSSASRPSRMPWTSMQPYRPRLYSEMSAQHDQQQHTRSQPHASSTPSSMDSSDDTESTHEDDIIREE